MKKSKLNGALTIEQCKEMVDKFNNLDLSGTQITSLPDNLTVGGEIYRWLNDK